MSKPSKCNHTLVKKIAIFYVDFHYNDMFDGDVLQSDVFLHVYLQNITIKYIIVMKVNIKASVKRVHIERLNTYIIYDIIYNVLCTLIRNKACNTEIISS